MISLFSGHMGNGESSTSVPWTFLQPPPGQVSSIHNLFTVHLPDRVRAPRSDPSCLPVTHFPIISGPFILLLLTTTMILNFLSWWDWKIFCIGLVKLDPRIFIQEIPFANTDFLELWWFGLRSPYRTHHPSKHG